MDFFFSLNFFVLEGEGKWFRYSSYFDFRGNLDFLFFPPGNLSLYFIKFSFIHLLLGEVFFLLLLSPF